MSAEELKQYESSRLSDPDGTPIEVSSLQELTQDFKGRYFEGFLIK